ncbi:hypothetical protein QTI47_14990 [Clostridium perfringens]|nr:hypothetical protein [Clostridium perfringens]
MIENNNILETKDFKAYEEELEDLVRNDKNNWTRFYILMEKVEKEELYRQRNFRSFTSWLKDFSIKNKIHESVLWNRKKAGRVYQQYQQLQAQRGIETEPIENIDVSMDSLVLLDKIQKKAPALGAELIEKTMKKQVTRQDLRTAYKQIRDAEPPKKPGRKKKLSEEEEMAKQAEFSKNNATATKITQLFTSSMWLLGYETTRKAFKVAEQQDKYISLPEFRVYTGTSTKSRRIDVLALENVTVKTKLHQLHAHGVEIKVDKHDLLNDHKYTEYAEFVHYLWLAVPRELVPLAEENAPPSVGIIAVEKDDTLVKVREAEKGEPLRLLDTFMVATMKLM